MAPIAVRTPVPAGDRESEKENVPTLVELQDVTKKYRRNKFELEVLSNIQLTLAQGDFVALMGPSGSGKTTLLNILAGIDRPSSGRVVVAGQDISKLAESELAPWRHRHIGFVFQFYNLIPVLTAYENVELPLTLTRLRRAQRRAKVETALKLVGLGDRTRHYPRQLSGGQEQRVAIARAIVTDPTLLLADEPTGDLDAKSAEEIMALIAQLNQEFGKTVVLVTHDPKTAAYAHSVVHLEKGELGNSPGRNT
jgi:putative ABC transport system ATP-binding protein